jgi:5-(carboxyamino)imidazole ribonucleotide synthase
MLWRILLNLPMGNPDAILPSVMVNIVGEPDAKGPVVYSGLEEVLQIDNAFIHLYGKAETRPGRKMGHVTVISKERQELLHQAGKIKRLLKAGDGRTIVSSPVSK